MYSHINPQSFCLGSQTSTHDIVNRQSNSIGILMTEDWAATLAQNEISDVHTPWDDEQTVTGRLRATDNLAMLIPLGQRLTPYSLVQPILPFCECFYSYIDFNPYFSTNPKGFPVSRVFPNGAAFGSGNVLPFMRDHDVPLHSAAQSTSVQRDTSGNFGTAAIHAVRRPKPCPPGYKKRPFTNKMAREIARRHSIPYQEVCQYYHYDWVDELYHHCPIADCTSGQNTFRGDTIKTHLEHYHPNITVEEKVVCARKSHKTSNCQPGNDVMGKSYEQHFREKHSDAHSLCPFCGRRYRRADYLCKHFGRCKNF
ncbi:uncharacterized protein ARMOST_12231 [Armillaria ostoyae]|uniref:Uncharacterized protein n=1 Tax=Armillaria ostoyae TaxID=47428 RepID=A0A284RJC9_ARMOS|nr:uncharacterized protein ARMOST_12231 [Armillaria ostoyae]